MTWENRTQDANLALKTAGLVAATAAGSTIVDLGGATFGEVQVDITAIEVASNDEFYQIGLYGSNSSSFASGIVLLAAINVGAVGGSGTAAQGALTSAADGTGRRYFGFRNEIDGTVYRYVRIGTVAKGTIATGINYTAAIVQRK